jgi:diguanylate cyclase (GGDEF)-like protein
MVADGRPIGAIVLEHQNGRLPGVERRVIGVVAQVAAMTALNLRNAVLLRRVRDLAERDALTGAANRRSFQGSLEQVVGARRAGDGRTSAVLFIDLDDFKIVNDTLGHAIGDELLVAVTERISSLVREGDVVARLGGDEFAILTEDLPDLRRARAIADRLVRELRKPYLLGGHPVTISASIGIAGANDAVDGAGDLVRNADVAMYMAKAGGKAGFAIFDPGMHHVIRERHELALQLQQAVDLDQLELRYQPIVGLADGALAGVEALVRWRHPERGLIAPGQFIELAEEHGSILPIGRWVLREACRQAAQWAAAGATPPGMYVAVNVSAREFQEPGFVDGVREALSDHGVPATGLVIEITETALLRATPTTIATLQGLRDLGVRVVIDDFGTGYFSLSHLRQFPVDALKIAREFTQEGESETATRSSALAAAIVAMARSLGIETVAEGIETQAQADRMRSLACTYGQGYYFARPLLPADLPEAARETVAALAELAAQPDAASEVDRAQGRSRRRRRVAEPRLAVTRAPSGAA